MTKQMTRADYERLLLENENELWAMVERHGKLAKRVRDDLWPRARDDGGGPAGRVRRGAVRAGVRGGRMNDGTIILGETPDVRVDSYRETKFEYTETFGNANKSVSIDTYMTNEELVTLCRELLTATGEVDA